MSAFSQQLLDGTTAGIIGGLVLFLYLAFFSSRRTCPECGVPLPRFRNTWRPPNVVWTCPECGCRVGVQGRKVEA
jgi:hypothetical protein